MSKKNEKKQKKEKIVYVDDGSTVVDMSALNPSRQKSAVDSTDQTSRPRWRQILDTYFESVKMMLLPMLIFMGAIALVFLIVWLLFRFVA